MQTRREALVTAGLAKPGRGKFSKDAVRWLAEQRAKGITFSDDDAPVKTVKPTVKEETPTGPTTVDPRDTPYLTPDEYRFPEAEYRAVAFINGKRKEYSLRECCNRCKVSLVNHACDTPTIHGDVSVRIERR